MSEVINLNNTTPAAPSGQINGAWQKSATPSGTDPTTGQPIFDVSMNVPIGAGVTWANETPAGTMNGVNLIFTLANTPNPAGSLFMFLNGVVQDTLVDISISGPTITFTVAPKSTDQMRAMYTH